MEVKKETPSYTFEVELASLFPNTPLQYAYTKQIHSDTIKKVMSVGNFEDTDALYTSLPNMVLSVYTADCLPFVAFCPPNQTFGIAHAGWKGTQKQIVPKLLKTILGSKPLETPFYMDILPHICSNCYEVTKEFQNFFPFSPPYFYSHNDGKITFDLKKENERQITEEGFSTEYFFSSKEEPIFSNWCTYEDPSLPSYRQNKNNEERVRNFCFLLSPEP